jgi:serine/threonine-protein kinase RsbW
MSNSRTDTPKLLYRKLKLHSSPGVIHKVEGAIDEIRTELEIRDDVYGNVMVAVTEAVNNSVVHGNQSDPNKKVFLDFEMENQYRLVVRVRDEGPGFDPQKLSDPTAPENLENVGGRGVFLMRQLADELTFLDDGRIVEMCFNI